MPSASDPGSLAYRHSERTLPGGLAVVEVELPHLHRGAISAFFRTGSLYESPRENGLSHFLEHMIFRGTDLHPSGYDLNLAVEKLGGTLFAATGPDSTEFGLTLPTECLVPGARLLAEVVTRPIFGEMEIERRIISEEIREDLDEKGNPIDIDFLSRRRLWPGHPLGQSVTGPLDNVLGFTDGEVRARFRDTYTAPNAVICLAGAFDARALVPVVEEAFSAIPTNGAGWQSARPPLGRGPTVQHVHRAGSQTQVRIAFHAPGGGDPDRTALAMLLGVLDDGMSTRLHRRIFDELGLAYHVAAEVELYRDAGALNIDAAASHEKVVEIVEQIGAMVTAIRDASVSEEELEKARNREIWAIRSFLDDPHAMSAWYGDQALHWQPIALEDRIRNVAAIGPEEIMRVAGRIFSPANLHITTVGVLDARAVQAIERAALRFS